MTGDEGQGRTEGREEREEREEETASNYQGKSDKAGQLPGQK
jgi:hypothetical protein